MVSFRFFPRRLKRCFFRRVSTHTPRAQRHTLSSHTIHHMLAAAARAAARASRRGATSVQKRLSSSSSHEEEVRQMGLWRTVTFAGE